MSEFTMYGYLKNYELEKNRIIVRIARDMICNSEAYDPSDLTYIESEFNLPQNKVELYRVLDLIQSEDFEVEIYEVDDLHRMTITDCRNNEYNFECIDLAIRYHDYSVDEWKRMYYESITRSREMLNSEVRKNINLRKSQKRIHEFTENELRKTTIKLNRFGVDNDNKVLKYKVAIKLLERLRKLINS